MKNCRFGIVLAFIGPMTMQAAPAAAEGCRIVITARGYFWGRVIDHGYTPLTRFAVTVEHDIQDVAWQIPGKGPYLRKCPAIARSALPVEITAAHDNADPLVYLFLFMARRSAESVRFSGASPEIDATIEELADASRQLQIEVVSAGTKEAAIQLTADLASFSGLGWGEKQIVGYLTDVAKVSVKGGAGSAIESRMLSLVLGRLKPGISDADAQRVTGHMIDLGRRLKSALDQEVLKPITLTGTGSDGECDLYYNVNLDANKGEYVVNFMRTCGTPDSTPDLRGSLSTNRLELDPGAAAAFTGSVIEIGPTGKIIHHRVTNAHTGGLAAVTDADEAAVTGLGTHAAKLEFQVADIKEDKEYPFQVILTTAGGSAAPIPAKVIVQNVAPTIDPPRLSVKAKPNDLMTLTGNVRILDRNADDNNEHEVVLFPKPKAKDHPDQLETTRMFAKLDTFDCGGDLPVNGVYTCVVTWRKGRVGRTHPHGMFSSGVEIKDDLDQTAWLELNLEVEDVLPRVISITTPKRDFMEGDGETVSVSAQLLDYNGRDDIIDVRIDATEAGGGVYHLNHFDTDAPDINDDPDRNYDPSIEITLKSAHDFPHKDVEGRYAIKILAIDGPPAPSDSVEEDTLIKVGNFAPRLCASGIIWGSDRGPARALCPGESFTLGVCVEDEEDDKLEVIATLAGQTVALTHVAGANNWTGNLFAPREPGRYTVTVTMREMNRPKPKEIIELIEIDVIECDEPTDATWDSKVIPTELCPNDPFTVEPTATLFMTSGNRVIHPDSEVLFEGRQGLTRCGPSLASTLPIGPAATPSTSPRMFWAATSSTTKPSPWVRASRRRRRRRKRRRST